MTNENMVKIGAYLVKLLDKGVTRAVTGRSQIKLMELRKALEDKLPLDHADFMFVLECILVYDESVAERKRLKEKADAAKNN